MDFRTITNITTPVGDLVRIRRKTDNKIIWEKNTGIEIVPTWENDSRDPRYYAYYPYYRFTGLTAGKEYTLTFKNSEFDMVVFTYTTYAAQPYAMVSTYKSSTSAKGAVIYDPGGVVECVKTDTMFCSFHIVNPQPITFTAPAASGYIHMMCNSIGLNPRMYQSISNAMRGTSWYTNPELYTVIIKEV